MSVANNLVVLVMPSALAEYLAAVIAAGGNEELLSRLDAVEGDVETLSGDVSSLEGRVDALENPPSP